LMVNSRQWQTSTTLEIHRLARAANKSVFNN
jgi:hypothetical protein